MRWGIREGGLEELSEGLQSPPSYLGLSPAEKPGPPVAADREGWEGSGVGNSFISHL